MQVRQVSCLIQFLLSGTRTGRQRWIVCVSRESHGSWKARYLDAEDRDRSKCFARMADAEKFLTLVTADVLRGTYLDPDAGKITLRRYATGQWLPSRS